MLRTARDGLMRSRDIPTPFTGAFVNPILKQALDACDQPVAQETDPLTALRDKRKALSTGLDAFLAIPAREGRSLQASESRDFDVVVAKAKTISARIEQLETEETRSAAANRVRMEAGMTGIQTGLQAGYVNDASTYHRGAESPSYFKDMIYAGRGDYDAAQRLQRNNREAGTEFRALGNTGAAGGAGGEFAPPLWIVEDYIRLARPGRVTADLYRKNALPPGISSVNIPKVATGTTTAVQTTQNSALSQTDLTSASLSAGIVTIGGKQIISQQLIDQSGIPFDQMILEDLAADYAKQIGIQALTGSGTSGQLRGYLTPASTNVVTWTQASPTVAGFYGQLAKLQSQIYATRFQAPDTVVMHPRRWAWFASGTDSSGRPLVVPDTSGGSFNVIAESMGSVEAGHVGSVLGMDVYTDPNIPTNTGAGTNQDTVLMFPRNDIWLWESTYRAETFTQTYGDSMGVLVRLYNYSALIPDRYLASLGQISGTGLTPPTFAS